LAINHRSSGLASIFDDRDIALVRQFSETFHLSQSAVQMRDDYRGRIWADRFGNSVYIEATRGRIDIDKNDLSADYLDGSEIASEVVGGQNNLIARADPQASQSKLDCDCAA
jgi:hypothetical protein